MGYCAVHHNLKPWNSSSSAFLSSELPASPGQRPKSVWLGAISVWTLASTLWDLAAGAPPVHLASPGDSVWWTTPALLEDIPVTTTTSCLSENAARVKFACLCLDQAAGVVSACLLILLLLGLPFINITLTI